MVKSVKHFTFKISSLSTLSPPFFKRSPLGKNKNPYNNMNKEKRKAAVYKNTNNDFNRKIHS